MKKSIIALAMLMCSIAVSGQLSDFCDDLDNDGYAASIETGLCGTVADCDEGDQHVNPGAEEACNSIDDNCNDLIDEGFTVTLYADADMDTFGNADIAMEACIEPEGFVIDGKDCDDTNADVNPWAIESMNGIDDNCDGNIDEGIVPEFGSLAAMAAILGAAAVVYVKRKD